MNGLKTRLSSCKHELMIDWVKTCEWHISFPKNVYLNRQLLNVNFVTKTISAISEGWAWKTMVFNQVMSYDGNFILGGLMWVSYSRQTRNTLVLENQSNRTYEFLRCNKSGQISQKVRVGHFWPLSPLLHYHWTLHPCFSLSFILIRNKKTAFW